MQVSKYSGIHCKYKRLYVITMGDIAVDLYRDRPYIDNYRMSSPIDQSQDPDPDPEVEALSNNKVGVEIEPDVKANRVNVQICSCSFSLILNCFSPNKKP